MCGRNLHQQGRNTPQISVKSIQVTTLAINYPRELSMLRVGFTPHAFSDLLRGHRPDPERWLGAGRENL
jgi:hypothetical protein